MEKITLTITSFIMKKRGGIIAIKFKVLKKKKGVLSDLYRIKRIKPPLFLSPQNVTLFWGLGINDKYFLSYLLFIILPLFFSKLSRFESTNLYSQIRLHVCLGIVYKLVFCFLAFIYRLLLHTPRVCSPTHPHPPGTYGWVPWWVGPISLLRWSIK